jgi:hypothetical protein
MKASRAISVLVLLIVSATVTPALVAQRRAVTGAEVTGTFRSYFTGRFRNQYNEILIQVLGKNKLKIQMDLVYPYRVKGEVTANLGSADGEALIDGDKAVFTPDYSIEAKEECKITLRFTKPGTLIVSTENNDGCGFGHNVMADGTYRKTSNAKPQFGKNENR